MMKRALFANWINTIAVLAGLLLMRNFKGFCSTMKRAIYGTLGRFGLRRAISQYSRSYFVADAKPVRGRADFSVLHLIGLESG